MKKVIGIFLCLLFACFSVPAMAQGKKTYAVFTDGAANDPQPVEKVPPDSVVEDCVPRDQYECEKKRCRWNEARKTCFCTKWRTRWRKPAKKQAPPVQKVEKILKERLERIEKIVEKSRARVVRVPVEKKIFIQMPKKRKPKSEPKPKKVEKPWWWLSGGVFAQGIWQGREFFTGPSVRLKFALNDRFRVGGECGYSVWWPAIILGADFDVHLKEWHQGLFLKFSFQTIWSKYTDYHTVRNREFLGGIGGEYWITKWFSLSAEMLMGLKSYVPGDPNRPPLVGKIVAGNKIGISIHL